MNVRVHANYPVLVSDVIFVFLFHSTVIEQLSKKGSETRRGGEDIQGCYSDLNWGIWGYFLTTRSNAPTPLFILQLQQQSLMFPRVLRKT